MTVVLRRLSLDAGRKLWSETFKGCKAPSRSTKWFEVLEGLTVIGWCAYRYIPSRQGKLARLVSEGVYIAPAHRGRGLQNVVRQAMVDSCRTKGSKRKIQVDTYVSADNIASLRNCIKSGFVPYKVFREGEGLVFIRLEGLL